MSKIRLHGSSSGYMEIAPPAAGSSETITLPSSAGEVLLSDGSAASLTSIPAANIVGVTTAGFSGSITEVDSWLVSTNFTQPSSHGQYITANWQRKASSKFFAKKGTGMTESSGVFSFPKTGFYLIRVTLSISTVSGHNLAYCGPYIDISNDSGSNYDRVSESYTQMDHGTRYSTVNSEAFVSVTSTSTFRCRIETESSGNFTVRSSNGQSMLDFIRLGDAT